VTILLILLPTTLSFCFVFQVTAVIICSLRPALWKRPSRKLWRTAYTYLSCTVYILMSGNYQWFYISSENYRHRLSQGNIPVFSDGPWKKYQQIKFRCLVANLITASQKYRKVNCTTTQWSSAFGLCRLTGVLCENYPDDGQTASFCFHSSKQAAVRLSLKTRIMVASPLLLSSWT
jgi:hypothetical protein